MTEDKKSENYTIHCSFISDEEQRLDKYLSSLSEYLPLKLSRSQFEKSITTMFVNAKEVKKSYKLAKHDEIQVTLSVEQKQAGVKINESTDYEALYEQLDILYEDEYFIAINKARHMVVHPGAGNHDKTLAQIVFSHLTNYREEDKFNNRAGIVHRLDKDTSGVIVIAKTARMHDKLGRLFSNRGISKEYIAIVKGLPRNRNGTIENFIGRHPKLRKKYKVVPSSEKGKLSITDYRVLHSNGEYSAILCMPRTGRTHQIRVHMQHLGSPIIGDTIYSRGNVYYSHLNRNLARKKELKDDDDDICPLMLHAYRLSFDMSRGEDILSYDFKAKIPEDMNRALSLIGVEDISQLLD